MHFPVSNSNLSAKHLARFVQETYALGKDISCSLIRAGINDTYLIQGDNNRYVFRVYSLDWRTKTEIQEEISLLNLLKENNISISYPIRDKNNNYIQVLNAPEGDRFAVLFSYADGKKIYNYPEETHFRIGQLIANMHQLTHNRTLQRTSYTPEVLLVDSLTEIAKFLGADTEEMRFLQSTQSYLLKELAQADVNAIRKGIIHLDIWFDNLNINEKDEVTIFDFDFCGNGWLCLDTAYYLMQLAQTERYDEKLYRPKTQQFLAGYESICPLSAEEKRLLPLLGVCLYYFYLGIQCRRYDNWSNSFLSEDYLKRFVNGIVKRYFELGR
jgi:Ser/Thr protein kinase RdoA (MazF antagonist)